MVVVLVTVAEEDIADVPEVMVQEMKTLRMKGDMLKTKVANLKDLEMVVIDVLEGIADDQGLCLKAKNFLPHFPFSLIVGKFLCIFYNKNKLDVKFSYTIFSAAF